MNVKYAIAALLSLACVSAAESPVNYRTYHGGIRVDSDPILLKAYQKALARCVPEASTPPRGNPNMHGLDYNSSLRNCLYRQGYLDRGVYSYPNRDLFDEILNR